MNYLSFWKLKKDLRKKIEIANKVYLKKQNLNLILKDLQSKKIISNDNKNTEITTLGLDLLEKTTNRINEKVIKIFQKTDPKNMAGFINIIESL
jgi:predicted transcriptional regulator